MSGGGARRLTKDGFSSAVRDLCTADVDLGAVVAEFGPPPIWRRPAGFPTLALLILEQQVSLASAKAACDRLTAACGGALTPEAAMSLDDDAMRGCGVSRQKTRYIRELAGAVAGGALRLDRFARADDETVREALTAIVGIGNWTADIYLMMALGRPDVWPVGDLALQVAAQAVKRLPERPSPDALVTIGAAWRPWRAVAARILWHYYLNTVRQRRGDSAT